MDKNIERLWDMFSDFFELTENSKPVRVEKHKDRVVVEIDVPGCSRENISLSVESNILSIEWNPPKGPKRTSHFRISRHADVEKIEAKVENGLLTIIVPGPTETPTRTIPVS